LDLDLVGFLLFDDLDLEANLKILGFGFKNGRQGETLFDFKIP
jgi:hypothetical protein